jgi:hypothetical protein
MSGSGGLDVRLPIGGLFTVLGVILTAYGALTAGDAAHYSRSLSFNINLWWGVVMLAFGLGLLLSATFYRRGQPGAPRTPSVEGRATEERERRLGLEG